MCGCVCVSLIVFVFEGACVGWFCVYKCVRAGV